MQLVMVLSRRREGQGGRTGVMMQGGGPVSASLTSSASSAARSPRRPGGDVISSPSSPLCWPEPSSLLLSPRRYPPAVSTQLRSRSGEPRSLGGRGLGDSGVVEREGGGLWPWANPVDFSSHFPGPTLVQRKCFSYPGLQRRQFADPTTYQTAVKHHVPDHALSWSSCV